VWCPRSVLLFTFMASSQLDNLAHKILATPKPNLRCRDPSRQMKMNRSSTKTDKQMEMEWQASVISYL